MSTKASDPAETEPIEEVKTYKTLAELDAEDDIPSDEKPEEEPEEEKEPVVEEKKPKARAKAKTPEPEPEPEEEEEPAEEPEEDPEEEEPSEDDDFFAAVDELHGEPLEVDYGDTDPMSPEGIFKREQAIADRSINQFEEILKERAPRHYAYLTHGLNGGSDEEFFEKTEGLDSLPSEEELEVDEDIQRQVIERHLKAKGTSEKHIKAILKAAGEDDELEELAKEALSEEKTRQAKVLADIEKENTEALEARTKDIQEMTGYVEQIITSGKLGNINIPDKDRKAFAAQFNGALRYENGKFFSVTPLHKDNIEETFQKEYFAYKKGNLDGLVERRAKTVNTQRLKATINTNPKPKSAKEPGSKNLSLGEL